MKKGKLIVIEGLDGSGKTTFMNNLKTVLKDKKVKFAKSPTLANASVRSYLEGNLPKQGVEEEYYRRMISVFYSAARVQLFLELDEDGKNLFQYMEDGYNIICDRWILSNYIYQGMNIPNKGKFYSDLHILETEYLGLPMADSTIILDISVDQAIKNLTNDSKYLDIHENVDTLNKVYNMIRGLDVFGDLIKIDVCDENGMKSFDDMMTDNIKKLFDL